MLIEKTKDIVSEYEIIEYSVYVPFHNTITVCEKVLQNNDTLYPEEITSDIVHLPGNGAIYRLIGDGTHSPTFAAPFKKSGSSGDYVATAGTLNLITFLFDGVDYWYNIIQPV